MEKFEPLDRTKRAPSSETKEERSARLSSLLQTSAPDLLEEASVDQLIPHLISLEDDVRALEGDGALVLIASDLTPAFKAETIKHIASERVQDELHSLEQEVRSKANLDALLEDQVASNDNAIDDAQDEVALNQGQLAQTLETEEAVAQDLKTVEDLQLHFEALSRSIGTHAALKQLLEPGLLKSQAMQDLVRRVLATTVALISAVPGKEALVQRMLDNHGLQLAASTPSGMFAGFLDQVELTPDLSQSEKRQLRALVLDEQAIVTGRDVRSQTLSTIKDPKTGEVMPAYPEGHPRQLRDGVESFTRTGQDLVLRFRHKSQGPSEYDVTGWSDVDIGLLTEALGFVAGLEEAGLAVLSNLIIEQTITGQDQRLDQPDIKELRKVLSALLGGLETYDGDIFDAKRRMPILKYQAELLAPNNKQQDPLEPLLQLGLINEKGQLNYDQLQRVGTFARTSFGVVKADQKDLAVYLERPTPPPKLRLINE